MIFAFAIMICGRPCGKACVWLGESGLNESAEFQVIFESVLCFVEDLLVSAEIGDSFIAVCCRMIEGGWLDLALTYKGSLFGFLYR